MNGQLRKIHSKGGVGIVREVYNKWERRVPLCPIHVKELISSGIPVRIQPSYSRIFTNQEYEAVGATISDDLTPSSIIVGVKQVPKESLLPDKTYMFFSHTIKAQQKNMKMLDEILKKNIKLIDYECIRDKGDQHGNRIVAFGKFAGRAGMVDSFRGIGERLLNLGFSTPFLNISSTYMYKDLKEAKRAVKSAGKEIARNGIPENIAPMTFVFTGNGKVSRGAQEIFRLMPHEMVKPQDLAFLPSNPNILYGCVVNENDMVQLAAGGSQVDKQHYYNHPEKYIPCFHEKILPYTSFMINGTYWDERYPRLITKEQMKDIYDKGNQRLIGIGDISCDINGSVEFLEKSTEIEDPFFLYDVKSQIVRDTLDGDGIMMMGVDILPSELPLESSKHFGDLLLKYVKKLSSSSDPLDQKDDVSKELKGACITRDGSFTKPFEYIGQMRAQKERGIALSEAKKLQENAGSTCVLFRGHLFDSGLINGALDVIEEEGGTFHIVKCDVIPSQNEPSGKISMINVQMSFDTKEKKDEIVKRLSILCDVTPGASATLTEIPDYCQGNYSATRKETGKGKYSHPQTDNDKISVKNQEKKKLVCLGSGLVASPLIEFLSRNQDHHVVVASSEESQAKSLVKRIGRPNIEICVLDARNEDAVDKLCKDAACVISLLPPPMHAEIAKICLKSVVPLVTASYVSPEMKSLDKQAKEAGIPILCEMGLDPGMDHMSAMKVIREVQNEGGYISTFSSVCGGLPAPEAANNPFMYKFSWSPQGVLNAAQNAACYRKDNQTIIVPGEDLLKHAELTRFLPALSLEQLPNRNCLPYGDIYGIQDAKSLFRGTLRYAGWSNIMYQCRQLGLLDANTRKLPKKWGDLMKSLLPTDNFDSNTKEALKWLGVFSNTPVAEKETIMGAFCSLLEEKLSYKNGEHDMAVMHHEFGIEYPEGRKEYRTSTFVGYGNEKDTIMSQTVGITAAVGCQLILQGSIKGTGVLTPTTSDIYNPGLALLEAEGFKFLESVTKL